MDQALAGRAQAGLTCVPRASRARRAADSGTGRRSATSPWASDADTGNAGIVAHPVRDAGRAAERSSPWSAAAARRRSPSPTRPTATLSAERDNAILVCHALSGDAHVAGWHERTTSAPAGGTCSSVPARRSTRTSTSSSAPTSSAAAAARPGRRPSTRPPAGRYGIRLPMITIADMVNAQVLLLDHLGIDKLLAVVGGSHGRHAGAAVGGRPSRSACTWRSPWPGGAAADAGDRLQRGRPPGDHGRSRLARRRLLRPPDARPRASPSRA